MGFFYGGVRKFFKIDNIFTYTCPNRSRVGAIDTPDRFEHVFDPYYILEAPKNIFVHEILIIRPRKWAKNSVFCFFSRKNSRGNTIVITQV